MTPATRTRKSLAGGHQFRALRFGHLSNSDAAPWDTVLYSDENFVVAPTKGFPYSPLAPCNTTQSGY